MSVVWPPFRLVFRSFERFEFDTGKNAIIFAARGVELPTASQIFRREVLERPDPRPHGEQRFQAVGELPGAVIVVIYTVRGRSCRLITTWRAGSKLTEFWYDRWQNRCD